MNDNEKQTGGWGRILGGILLVMVLFGCIKFVFWGLEQVIPKTQAGASSDVSVEPDAPSFCIHCGRALPESFRWGQFCPWCGEQVI